jgi:hypothetical protein
MPENRPEQPSYEWIRDAEEEAALMQLIEVLRACDGTIYRAAVRGFAMSDDPQAKTVHDLLVHHPNLRDLLPH